MIPAGEFYDMLVERLQDAQEQKLRDTLKARNWADSNRRVGKYQGLLNAQEIAAKLWLELQGKED